MRKCENLNGIWEFAYFGDNAPQAPFVTDEFMPVPSCFDLMEPHCGKRGYALYRREVVTGGLVELFIDGLGISAEIFFDGKSIRKLPYTYMPEKIVFDAGNEGKHELAILLCNKYDAQFQPNFDFFGYGHFVTVDHGFGYKTRYAHLSKVLVSEGQALRRGDQLGEMGNTGKSTGPHLHYEIIHKDRPVNPYKFFDFDLPAEDYQSIVRSIGLGGRS